MEHTLFHRYLEELCRKHGAALKIQPIHDRNRPHQEVVAEILYVNTAKIPADSYRKYVSYYVLQYLMPRLRLETERLILRRFHIEDAEDCFAFLSDADGAYMDCCQPFSAMDEAFRERIQLFVDRPGQYAIELKETGTVIGTVNVFEDSSRAVDAMEIGYAVRPDFQRRGYAYEALTAILHLFQQELMLDMVTAGILPENTASHGLLKKLGFRSEGIRHKAVWHDGLDKPVDLQYYYRDRECICLDTQH